MSFLVILSCFKSFSGHFTLFLVIFSQNLHYLHYFHYFIKLVGFKAWIENGGFQGLKWNWWVSRLKLKLVGFMAWIETGGFQGLNWNWWDSRLEIELKQVGFKVWIGTAGFQGFNWKCWASRLELKPVGFKAGTETHWFQGWELLK